MAEDASQDELLQRLASREIYIERQFHGPYAQVRAIDAATGLEVAVTTPSNAAQFDQNRLALRKLGQCLIAEGHIVMTIADKVDPNITLRPERPKSDVGKAASGTRHGPSAFPKGGIIT